MTRTEKILTFLAVCSWERAFSMLAGELGSQIVHAIVPDDLKSNYEGCNSARAECSVFVHLLAEKLGFEVQRGMKYHEIVRPLIKELTLLLATEEKPIEPA